MRREWKKEKKRWCVDLPPPGPPIATHTDTHSSTQRQFKGQVTDIANRARRRAPLRPVTSPPHDVTAKSQTTTVEPLGSRRHMKTLAGHLTP